MTLVRARMLRVVVVVLLSIGAAVACDPRACLAQSETFGFLREDLIEECCACLSLRGTKHPNNSCQPASVLLDGGIFIPETPDAGPEDEVPGEFGGDDGDDVRDDDERRCLCNGTLRTCRRALLDGDAIDINGACLDQADRLEDAPCEAACKGVLNYDPLPVAGT